MKSIYRLPLIVGLTLASMNGTLLAQTASTMSVAASPSRSQVKMERNEFLKSHRYDESTQTWVLKSGFEPPAGVMSRADVRSSRDEFLRTHRFDRNDGWVTLKTGPRDLGTMSRAQVQAETKQFLRSHRFNEESTSWEPKQEQAPKT